MIEQGDVMTCAGGCLGVQVMCTVWHMTVPQLHGTVHGIEGLPVEMVRGLGRLCARLQVHGNISHCAVDLGVLVSGSHPVELLPAAQGLLDQLQASKVGLRLFNGGGVELEYTH